MYILFKSYASLIYCVIKIPEKIKTCCLPRPSWLLLYCINTIILIWNPLTKYSPDTGYFENYQVFQNLFNLEIFFLYRSSIWLSTHSQLKINESLQICKLFAIETIVTISLNTYIYLYIYILSYSVCTSVQYYNSFSQQISLLSLEPNTIWMSGWQC